MKRKDLKAYIRTEIINELNVTEAGVIVKGQKGAVGIGKTTPDSEQSKVSQQTGLPTQDVKDLFKAAKLGEAEIDEMARKAGGYRIGDRDKFAEAKELYSAGLYSDLLNAIESAGDDGITQKELGIKLGKGDGSSLNSILNKFKTIGVFGGGKLAKIEKPGAEPETDIEEPDEFKDLYSVDVEDETPEEEEPTAVANDKELKKLTGDEYGKSDEVNKAISIVKNLSAKIKDMKNGIERDKKIAALKQYINNNKALLKGRDISVLTNNLLGGEI